MRRPSVLSTLSIISALVLATGSGLAGLTLWSAPAAGDQLQMVPPPAADAAHRPSRGLTMEKVEAKYGAPARKVAPVGQPPIERWEYPGFTVYFEYRKVIHSVAAPATAT
jgi:hypothetical protein